MLVFAPATDHTSAQRFGKKHQGKRVAAIVLLHHTGKWFQKQFYTFESTTPCSGTRPLRALTSLLASQQFSYFCYTPHRSTSYLLPETSSYANVRVCSVYLCMFTYDAIYALVILKRVIQFLSGLRSYAGVYNIYIIAQRCICHTRPDSITSPETAE